LGRFQSAPPRGGRRRVPAGQRRLDAVSIRAPAWGATRPGFDCRVQNRVSIRAPAWGATPPTWTVVSSFVVSIRAPAWGATRWRLLFSTVAPGFNPRPRVGGDRHAHAPERPRPCFNPRPRVGGDPRVCFSFRFSVLFQSAPPRGGRRFDQADKFREKWVSIRAPAWGATTLRSMRKSARRCFNPRPRVGGDQTWIVP